MTGADWIAISPLIALAVTIVVVLVGIAVRRHHAATALLSLAGLALSGALLPVAAGVAPRGVTPLLVIDVYALVYLGLLIAAGAVVVILAHGYFARRATAPPEEFHLTVLIAVLGAAFLVSSRHFASFFLGFETLSVSLYVLVAYRRATARDAETGLKYLILAGASSAFLLFGMALLYAGHGTMELAPLAAELGRGAPAVLDRVGLALLVTGIGFKLALVPFHLWTPDVYEGAPAPATALLATVSKGAVFGLLLRYFPALDGGGALFPVLAVIAGASILAGNLLALLQDNVKRLLAYSSIAHLGYVLVAFLAGGELAGVAVTFYLAAYFATTLAAFGVVSLLSTPEREADQLADYRGLFWSRPAPAAVLTAALLSLAGIPLTAGFLGKFYVLTAGVGAALWTLALLLVAGSAIGLFYYLRVIATMYASPEPAPAAERIGPPAPLATTLTLATLGLIVIWLGVYPTPLLDLIRTGIAGLEGTARLATLP